MSAHAAETSLPFGFDPGSRAFRDEPWQVYAALQREEPVHRSPLGMWVLTRYDDVAALLRDPRFVMGSFAKRQAAMLGPGAASDMIQRSLFFMDAPDHGRLRGLVSRAFTPAAIERLRGRIAEIVDELLAGARERGRLDVIGDLAFPLPVRVIAEMLGVPERDRDDFHRWTQAMNLSFEPAITPDMARRCHAGVAELDAYLRDLVRAHRAEPRDDVLSGMITAEISGDRLTEDEIVANTALLLSAGYETTMGLLGNAALSLLRFPDQLARLADDPELLPNAVEECLRHESPVQFTARETNVAVEVRGVEIPAGELCLMMVAAANRDPLDFERPEQLEIGRPNAGDQVAFGGGRHFCLGAPLSRLEGRIALAKLIPLLRAAEPENESLPWRDSFLNHALESLPLRLLATN